ncbi:hypothetical protein GVAV_003128 [Gurleya vavrai]
MFKQANNNLPQAFENTNIFNTEQIYSEPVEIKNNYVYNKNKNDFSCKFCFKINRHSRSVDNFPDQNEDFTSQKLCSKIVDINILKNAAKIGPYIHKNYKYAAILHQYSTLIFDSLSNLSIEDIANANGPTFELVLLLQKLVVDAAKISLLMYEEKEVTKKIQVLDAKIRTFTEEEILNIKGEYNTQKLRLSVLEDEIFDLSQKIIPMYRDFKNKSKNLNKNNNYDERME